ncbi:hypothetical protein PG987_004655 [Apiospora arundinis]
MATIDQTAFRRDTKNPLRLKEQWRTTHHHRSPHAPPTPQTLIHRLPDKPDPATADSSSPRPRRPAKYILLLLAPTAVAGKVQIATTVAQTLGCPLYQGDSLHESSAKAAGLGVGSSTTDTDDGKGKGKPNEQRYRRMWLSKMTRTGLLFPEESRPANEGFFSGFGGGGGGSGSGTSSSAGSSRRGSDAASDTSSSSVGGWSSTTATTQYTNKPVFAEPDAAARERRANPALMVLTHPQLEGWHRTAIRESVGEYGVGVVFVPLYRNSSSSTNEDEEEEEEEDLPVLKPLDPRTMTSFGSFDQIAAAAALSSKKQPAGGPSLLGEEILLRVNVEGQIEELIQEIVEGARDIMMTVT